MSFQNFTKFGYTKLLIKLESSLFLYVRCDKLRATQKYTGFFFSLFIFCTFSVNIEGKTRQLIMTDFGEKKGQDAKLHGHIK